MKPFLYIALFILASGMILYYLKPKLSRIAPIKPETSVFVTAENRDLYRNGLKFRSIGVNRYNLLSYKPNHCANSFSNDEIDSMFSDFHELGITSVRFWMFQSFTAGGENLSRFNYILEKAKEYDLLLIPVFENHWADCTEGDVKSDSWYRSEYRQPYGNYPLSLKDYIGKIVPLFKNNPNILAWQIINEAENTDNDVLYEFAKDVSAYIKELDPIHLVSFGTTGTKISPEKYRSIHGIETIDILEFHDYDDIYNEIPDQLALRFEDSEALNKPLIVGESGIHNSISGRSDLISAKMNEFFKKGGAAYLLWSYGEPHMVDDGHNFDRSDPIAEVIKSTVKSLER